MTIYFSEYMIGSSIEKQPLGKSHNDQLKFF